MFLVVIVKGEVSLMAVSVSLSFVYVRATDFFVDLYTEGIYQL